MESSCVPQQAASEGGKHYITRSCIRAHRSHTRARLIRDILLQFLYVEWPTLLAETCSYQRPVLLMRHTHLSNYLCNTF